jgi:hypothetical protein
MRTAFNWIAAVVLVLVSSSSVFAGAKLTAPVYVSTTYRFANGDLGTARNSSDANQLIGCYVYAFASGSAFATCYARDAAGNSGSCTTSVSTLVQAAMSVGTDSYLWFNWNADGSCSEIDVRNNSYEQPKAP